MFNALDKDGDGYLSYEELAEGINKVLGQRSEAAELLTIYQKNMAKDSKINYQGKFQCSRS